MKDAMGELNMTVVTIVAIGAVAAFFTMVLWPQIRNKIQGGWDNVGAPEQENQIDYDQAGGNAGGNAGGGSIILPDYFDIPSIY